MNAFYITKSKKFIKYVKDLKVVGTGPYNDKTVSYLLRNGYIEITANNNS